MEPLAPQRRRLAAPSRSLQCVPIKMIVSQRPSTECAEVDRTRHAKSKQLTDARQGREIANKARRSAFAGAKHHEVGLRAPPIFDCFFASLYHLLRRPVYIVARAWSSAALRFTSYTVWQHTMMPHTTAECKGNLIHPSDFRIFAKQEAGVAIPKRLADVLVRQGRSSDDD